MSVSEDYYLCCLPYECCHRNASNRCFSVGPLITSQWRDFYQTCLSQRNSSLLIDALKRPCTKISGKAKREEHNGAIRATLKIRGKVEEQKTFSDDNVYPKIADSVNPIRKKNAEYLNRSQEPEYRLLQTIIGVTIPSKTCAIEKILDKIDDKFQIFTMARF